MSLKGKAKTLVEIIKETCSYVYITRCKDCIGQCEFEGTKSFAGLWVKLEDAQKEISRVRKERDEMEELANDVANQYSKKYEELKQKLRQLLTEFPKKHWNEAFEWKDYSTEEIDVWKKKFEELIQDGC